MIEYQRSHNWNATPQQAISIQKRLAKKIILSPKSSKITKIASCDVGFSLSTNKIVAAVVVFSFPQLKPLEKVIKIGTTNFPYIPGLLTFREGPILLKALSAVKERPDLAIFDGQGIAHPRRMGLATHMGILLDMPTIGCAKTRLYGMVSEPPSYRGSYSYIRDLKGRVVGAALRTRKDVRCVFVSAGHKIDLQTAIRIILTCSPVFRIPEPLRVAHAFTKNHSDNSLYR